MARQHSQLEKAQGAQVIGPHQCLNGAHASLLGIAWPTDHVPNRAQRLGKRRTNTGSGRLRPKRTEYNRDHDIPEQNAGDSVAKDREIGRGRVAL